MKLTAKIILRPTAEQVALLRETLQEANAACNYASQVAWDTQTFNRFLLHHLVYYGIREKFNLSGQATIRVIAKVATSYKSNRANRHIFQPLGAFPYDDQSLRFKCADQVISIWTVGGRQCIPYQCGERQYLLLKKRQGESKLSYSKRRYYLLVTCEVEALGPKSINDFLGIDMGIVNLATDSDGEFYGGGEIRKNCQKYIHRRRNLQKKRTAAARRKLCDLSGRQARYQLDINHRVSKHVVRKAKDTERGIAIEDLKGIRERTTVRRKQRAQHANWAFHQLRHLIGYKAEINGVIVVAVNPRNTSRTCPACGCVDKANRHSQYAFFCVSCGFSAPADIIAALNIRARAVANQPNAPCVQGNAV